MTVHVAIGNTDGRLTQAEWVEFYDLVDELLTATVDGVTVHGRWHSFPATLYVNACWAITLPDEHIETIKTLLGELARKFRQDAIAWASGPTELIGPNR